VYEVPHPSKDILVVDDDAIMRDLICDWLVAAGYAVRRAGDCRAGASSLDAAPPALVVSDMSMPGLSGTDAIRCLREKHPELPLIAISGHFGSGRGCSKGEAVRAGAVRTFAKPVKRADLLDAIAELIGPPER